VFVTVAFYGSFPLGSTLVGQYVVKVAVAFVGAFLVWLVVDLGKRWIGRPPSRFARPIGQVLDGYD